jgi:hypothetical protein
MFRFGLGLFAAAILAAGVAGTARAEDPLEIRLTIRDHRFEPAEVTVPPNREVVLIVTNADATPEEFESAGLRVERVIPPGQTATFRLRTLLPNRNYEFFGEFHQDTARGRLTVK